MTLDLLCDCFKTSGIIRWKNQINLFINKLKKIMYVIKNLNNVLKSPKLCQVYLVLVKSIIFYGVIGRGAFDNTTSLQLQTISIVLD